MSHRSLPSGGKPASELGLPPPLPRRQRRLPAILVALVVELALGAAVIRFAARPGAVVAPHPTRVRLTMLAPKPKPKPPAPKPPPPKPKPPPPPLPPPPKAPPPPRPKPRPRPRPTPPRPHIARPPPPPPAPVQAAPSAAAVASATMRYAAALNARVQAGLVVPEDVRMMQLSGRAVVAIRVAPDGQLLGVSIARSSGIGPIDRAALAAVRATRLPAFIGDMPRHPVTFDLTVRLRN